MSARNPFRIRSFQRTSGDDQFVRLFAPSALDVLEGASDLWEAPQYLRSAPGGGKTSLLRLMTPGPLRKVTGSVGRDPRFKDTVARLDAIGALKDGRPAVLGIMLSFSNDYRDLSGLDRRALQVFRALFSARVVLAALRTVLEYCDKTFPDDLAAIRAVWTPTDGAKVPGDADGLALRDWASAIEESAYDVLDSVRGEDADASRAMIGFDGLTWLASVQFFVDGSAIDARTILLMDEAQDLTADQRASLNEALTALRKPVGIWVAERLQALQADDLLAPGVKQGRDYGSEIRLEDTWRGKGTGPLRRFLGEIADLRVDQADGFQGARFFTFLAAELADPKWREKFGGHAAVIEAEVLASSKDTPRYSRWIEATRATQGDEVERAIAWQTLKIFVERDRGRNQASFEFDALPPETLNDGSQAIRDAAELMVSKAIKAPYYFGQDRLAQLSSANVDQFLALAGDLFDEVMSARVLRRPEHLSAQRQHEILKAAAEQRWKEIPRGSARGHAVLRFLEGFAQMCCEETYRDTAPYAPGVTGIGISMSDRDLVTGEKSGGSKKVMQELREVLASCVAQNLLEPRLDAANKGQRWLVLYFNRLLCLHHDLPLGYGGWRPQKLQTLTKWLTGANGSSAQEARLV